MGNQYSITVSDAAEKRLKKLKEKDLKVSRIISDLLEHHDMETILAIHARAKRRAAVKAGVEQAESVLARLEATVRQFRLSRRYETAIIQDLEEAVDCLPIL